MKKWLVYSLATVLAWGAWGALAKAVEHVPAGQTQALSTWGVLPVMLAACLSPKVRQGTAMWLGGLIALVSGLMVGLGNLAYYAALTMGSQVATTISLTMLYPLVTVILALALLRERPSLWQACGVAGSLAAIYLLNVSGRPEVRTVDTIVALAPILFWGVGAFVMNVSTRHVSAENATFWFLAAFIPLGLFLWWREPVWGDQRFSLVSPMWVALSARDWVIVFLIGATFALGNLTILAAYRLGGPASIVTPISGLYPMITIPLAMVFFHERPGMREFAGIALAIASAVLLVLAPTKIESNTATAGDSLADEPTPVPDN